MTTSSSRSTSPRPAQPAMNGYGTTAWEHWERHRPAELASIQDPVGHFRDLGRLIEAEIDAATTERVGIDGAPSTAHAERVRLEVEEEILTAHLRLPEEAGSSRSTSPQELDDDLIDQIPVPLDSPMLAAWQASPLLDPPPDDPNR